MVTKPDLEGDLTVEGQLLEMVYAAFCVSRGEDVIPRQETLGVYHDVLIRGTKGYTFCECDGESSISVEKLELFRTDVLKLNSLLKQGGAAPVTEARLVVMLPRNMWSADAEHVIEDISTDFQANSIKLNIVEPKRLLYDLVYSSVLGLMLIDNHIIFAGPGHWALRYNASVSKFMYSDSSVDPDKFKRLPQSFIARDYWNIRHMDMFSEYVSVSKEAIPEWFSWQFPEHMGITWSSAEQMTVAIRRAYEKGGRDVVFSYPRGFLTLRSLKKESYYSAHLVVKTDLIGAESAETVDNEFNQIITGFRDSGHMDASLNVYIRMFTDTVSFSKMYWLKSKFRLLNGKPAYTEIHRGDDVLMEVLNSGDLGIKLEGNKIRLSIEEGPNILSLVRGALQWESSEEGTYPATLKF